MNNKIKFLTFWDINSSTMKIAIDNNANRLDIIQGKAGTGKSCVINEMVTRIHSKCEGNASLLMAPTEVAANNIIGQTLHSALRIPAKKKIVGIS